VVNAESLWWTEPASFVSACGEQDRQRQNSTAVKTRLAAAISRTAWRGCDNNQRGRTATAWFVGAGVVERSLVVWVVRECGTGASGRGENAAALKERAAAKREGVW
jgi:hypothetical protein